MKNAYYIFVLLVGALAPMAHAQTVALFEVSIDDRIGHSDAIVEGRVVGQRSFWNVDRTRIFTANTIEPYRAFKGDLRGPTFDVITPGGVVGMKAQVVAPALQLGVGDTGLFFLVSTAVVGLEKTEQDQSFDPYASVQGFLRYDERTGMATDAFRTYRDIRLDVHEPLIARLGQPTVWQHYSVARPLANAPKSVQVPVITSFSPGTVTAGNGVVLTINGTGFEAQGTNSTVLFPNADDGGGTLITTPDTEIIAWSDTQIQVRVPTRAGSGNFTVQTNSSQQGSSATSLTVDYNLINIAFNGFKRSILRAKVNGGYSLVMSTNTSSQGADFATSAAVDPFNRALATWQTATGFNLRNDGGLTTSNVVAPNDDPDIVMFDNDGNPLPNGVLGRAFSGFTSTNGEDWFVEGVDIQFRRDGTNNVTWNFGPSSTQFCCFDFESVALHELGHTHQLGHIIEPGAVMNFNISNGSDVRALDSVSDIAGGNDVLDFAATKSGGMSRLVGVGIEEKPAVTQRGVVVSDAYPNPTSAESVIGVEVDRAQQVSIDVYDLLGRHVLQLFDGLLPAKSRYDFGVGLSTLPAGVYIYSVTTDSGKYSRSLVLQR